MSWTKDFMHWVGGHFKDYEKRIAELEKRLEPIAPPKTYMSISADALRAKIKEVFPNVNILLIADRSYEMTTVSEMDRFLIRDDTDKIQWQKDAPDCDDFTRRLLGNLTIPGWWSIPKGDCWVSGTDWAHSILIAVLFDNEHDLKLGVYFIEGQTDAYELAPEMFEDITVELIKI